MATFQLDDDSKSLHKKWLFHNFHGQSAYPHVRYPHDKYSLNNGLLTIVVPLIRPAIKALFLIGGTSHGGPGWPAFGVPRWMLPSNTPPFAAALQHVAPSEDALWSNSLARQRMYTQSVSWIPSRELTYPTLGKGKSSSKSHFWGIC